MRLMQTPFTHDAATRPRHGLSLIEVIVSMLLVGLLLVGSLKSVAGIFQAWEAAQGVHDGLGLAQQLMTEILQQNYEDPDSPPLLGIESPELAQDRSTWDDVDDYHGWSAAPESKYGTPLEDYENWRRAVNIQYARLSDPAQVSLTDQGLKQITVTVTDPSGRQTVLYAFRSRWGMLEQSPQLSSTAQTHVASELQIGTGPKLQSGGHLLNDRGRP